MSICRRASEALGCCPPEDYAKIDAETGESLPLVTGPPGSQIDRAFIVAIHEEHGYLVLYVRIF